MGEVWLARDPRLGREVAIKVLPPQFAVDPERVARFEREARAAAALNHPHIAAVYDIGEHDAGMRFIVQEYLQGQSLKALLASGRLPIKRVAQAGNGDRRGARRGSRRRDHPSRYQAGQRVRYPGAAMPRCSTSAWPS